MLFWEKLYKGADKQNRNVYTYLGKKMNGCGASS